MKIQNHKLLIRWKRTDHTNHCLTLNGAPYQQTEEVTKVLIHKDDIDKIRTHPKDLAQIMVGSKYRSTHYVVTITGIFHLQFKYD